MTERNAMFELFSQRRRRREREGQPVIYTYDQLPPKFRGQVVHIMLRVIGDSRENGTAYLTQDDIPVGPPERYWQFVAQRTAEEQGALQLSMGNLYSERVLNEFVSSDFLTAMNILELVFGFAERSLKDFYDHDRERCGISLPPDAAALLLNQRFLEHDLGYQLIGDQIVRIDSQHLHADVVSPALHLLYEQTFRGASDEYLRAHEHYRRGRYEESVADALKAFESTMKQICDERGWEYPAGATARRLVQVLLNRGLLPTYADNYHNMLVGLLEGGVPTIRNSTAGHGTGSTPRDVSPHLASFTLHLAAANIVYLVEVHKAMARP